MFSWWQLRRLWKAVTRAAGKGAGTRAVSAAKRRSPRASLQLESLEVRLTPSAVTPGDNGHVYGMLDAPSVPGWYFEARRPGSKRWVVEGPFATTNDLRNAEKKLRHKHYAVRAETFYFPDPGPLSPVVQAPVPPAPATAPASVQLIVVSAQDPAALTPGTLRYAVNQANQDAAGGVSATIVFDPARMGAGTITLSQGQLELTPGSGTVTIDGGKRIDVSGNGASRVFQVDAGAQAVLQGLTIEAGRVSGNGGAISNQGTLTLDKDGVTGNTAVTGQAAASGAGGGIYNAGTLTVTSSTFSNNTSGVAGGAISSGGGLTVTGCEFFANSSGNGGAIDGAGTVAPTRRKRSRPWSSASRPRRPPARCSAFPSPPWMSTATSPPTSAARPS
jgi:predicted outer membrane repeat protein